MWRTPLLPVDELTAWGERLRAPAAVEAAEDLGAAVAADRAALRQRLAVAVDRPEIRETLHVAAPRLQRAVGAWLADPAGKRGRGVERGLVRCLTRMAPRPTRISATKRLYSVTRRTRKSQACRRSSSL